MKTLSTRLRPVRIIRALRYPTYRRLAVQRALLPSVGNIMMGVNNFCSHGLGALHGSSSVSVITAHIVMYVVTVVPKGAL